MPDPPVLTFRPFNQIQIRYKGQTPNNDTGSGAFTLALLESLISSSQGIATPAAGYDVRIQWIRTHLLQDEQPPSENTVVSNEVSLVVKYSNYLTSASLSDQLDTPGRDHFANTGYQYPDSIFQESVNTKTAAGTAPATIFVAPNSPALLGYIHTFSLLWRSAAPLSPNFNI